MPLKGGDGEPSKTAFPNPSREIRRSPDGEAPVPGGEASDAVALLGSFLGVKPRSALLPLALSVSALGRAASPVGPWTGRLAAEVPALPAGMPPAQRAMAERTIAQIRDGRIYLALRADHTSSTRIVGLPSLGTQSRGTWSQRGSVVTMREAKAGVRPMDFTLAKDGRTLSSPLPGAHGSMLFSR